MERHIHRQTGTSLLGRWTAALRLSAVICSLAAVGSLPAFAEQPSVSDAFPQRVAPRVRMTSLDFLQADSERPWISAAQSSSSRLRLVNDEAEALGPQTLMEWSGGGGEDEDGPKSKLDEPLVTDRPDFTEASTTVGKGVLQIEFGYTYTHDADGGSNTIEQSFGEPLFRYGMFADWFEWRLAVKPIQVRDSSATARNTTAGIEDLYLGAKLALTPQDGILPEIAIMPQMTVPSGSSAFRANKVLPGVNVLYGWDVTDRLAWGGSSQWNNSVDDVDDTYVEYAQSFTVNYLWTEELSSYTEWFAFFPISAQDAQNEHYLDGGFVYLITNDLQFDIRAGVGLNSAAADYFVGTGLSIRLH